MLAAPLVLLLASRAASADCVIFGMRPTVALPTGGRQEFSFLASDDCATLRFSIRGTGLSWTPRGDSVAGPGPSTFRVVLTDEEWDEVVALSEATLTWNVTGTTSDGLVTRVSTTNDILLPRDLATADAVLLGEDGWSNTGRSLANVGDVDGDGQVDVLIGAPWINDDDDTLYDRIGAAYLSTGPVSGTIDLSGVSARFIGAAPSWGDGAGESVAGAGDVNADGYDDVIIGAPGIMDEPGHTGGAAYLVLGPVTGSFDLSLADATFFASTYDAQAGASVSSAGDMDGDGLPDLLVGAPRAQLRRPAEPGGAAAESGAAYVLSGTRRGSHDLEDADARMLGANNDLVGTSVNGLGDVDGDGLDDILVAAPWADRFGHGGVSYVLFGPVDGRLNPADADATLVGESSSDRAGHSTAAAGDVDADGLRDILIGAIGQDDDNVYRRGAAYLVHGGVTGTLRLGNADAKLIGEAEGDEAGWSVSGAADVDADGHDDLLVGAPQLAVAGTYAGVAYLVRGPVTGSLDLGRADRKLVGADGDAAGYAVSSAGDLDGDGRADVLVGAPGHSVDGVVLGAAYVLYGSEL